MMEFAFDIGPRPAVSVSGSDVLFPVNRIFCVGRNYADHAREMGHDPDREPPFFFMKPTTALVADGVDVPYPPRTANLHFEVELVVALAQGGRNVPIDQATSLIFGFAVGNDLTRRDLQTDSKKSGRPWDTAKGFDHSAPISAIYPARVGDPLPDGGIVLTVNGVERQRSVLSAMIWSVPEIIAELSTLYTLQPGDLIFTGTPAGVGPVSPGDLIVCSIDGLGTLTSRIV